MLTCYDTSNNAAIQILPICKKDFTAWFKAQPQRIKNLLTVNSFSAEANTFFLLTGSEGELEKVILIVESADDFLAFGVLPLNLPLGSYVLDETHLSREQIRHAAIGWGMGSYQYIQFKTAKRAPAKLVCKDRNGLTQVNNLVETIFWVRDMINMPAENMYPEVLALEAQKLAKEYSAQLRVIKDEELRREFPAIYAVGRGSEKKPLLLDLTYGKSGAPKVVLVGKGVCFDSGGLQLKSSSAIMLMKKDMAGAAHVLGLARLIMAAKLPVNLRVIIPAVENLISGSSLKPGDIITTRQGLHIEIANTDAEGRLILADALALASSWKPELILDFATLTMAARIALGPDIAALFTPDEELAKDIIEVAESECEPVWRLPLYQPYWDSLKSKSADFKNVSTGDGPSAGAIAAALVLQKFVSPNISWAHFDINAYNAKTKPGRPEGGEVECIKGVFKYLERRFGSGSP